MILSLTIVIVAAILAAIALFFLLGSHIAQIKKQQILVIMGLLIFLSLLISNFKSQDIITFSLLNSVTKNKLNTIFSNQLPAYSHKYSLDPTLLGNYLLDRNYEFGSGNKDYNQNIIYLSDKDQGASFFLYQLSQKLRAQGVPAFYVKMESPSGTSKQFFRKTGLNSFEAFKHALEYYLPLKSRPYVIIDNAQLLPRPVWDIIASYQQSKAPNIILNSENVDALLERMSQIDRSQLTALGGNFIKRFQVQRFIGPDQSVLQKLSPSNSFAKKLPINFDVINNFRAGSTEEEFILKNSNADNSVASYFGLSSYYNQLKRILERGPVAFGKLRQSSIPFQILQQMERLRLITFRNGQVSLQ